MATVRRTHDFDRWLKELTDRKARAKIIVRIQRMETGNLGDVKPAGSGISEMRIDFGPGYRIYFKQTGSLFALLRGPEYTLLCGGDKGSQPTDIKRAKQIAAKLKG